MNKIINPKQVLRTGSILKITGNFDFYSNPAYVVLAQVGRGKFTLFDVRDISENNHDSFNRIIDEPVELNWKNLTLENVIDTLLINTELGKFESVEVVSLSWPNLLLKN